VVTTVGDVNGGVAVEFEPPMTGLTVRIATHSTATSDALVQLFRI
jgi:hypothetical protein